jgi:hypothetical protein
MGKIEGRNMEVGRLEGEPTKEEREKAGEEMEKKVSLIFSKEIAEMGESLAKKYGAEFELKKETKKSLDEILKRETEEKMVDYAKKWFEDNKDKLEGIPVEELSKERIISLAIEKGALKDLPEYEKYNKEIENLFTLREQLKKESVSIDTLLLTLNSLEKKTEEISAEIGEMEKEGKLSAEISLKEKELKRLSDLKKELAEKITGKNLEKEAEDEAKEEIGSKENYINKKLDEQVKESEKKFKKKIFEKEFKEEFLKEISEDEEKEKKILEFTDQKIESIATLHKLTKEDAFYLLAAGYNPEKFKSKGIIRKKIEVKKGEEIAPNKLEDFKKEQIEEGRKKIEGMARKKLGEKWEEEYQKSFQKCLEEKIKKIAESPENVIEELYGKLKDRLIAERTERELKKERKTREELREIERKFETKGVDPLEFFEKAFGFWREEATGDFEKDKEGISGLLKEYRIDIPSQKLESLVDSKKYKESIEDEKGFLRWLIELIFGLLEGAGK